MVLQDNSSVLSVVAQLRCFGSKKVRLKFIKQKSNRTIEFNELCFTKHVFTEETEFKKKMFFLSFGEFGCETLLPTFLIPRITSNFPEYRKIVVGWNNREYFYREICDEFWELHPKYMSLKDHSHAFENISVEISSLNKRLNPLGIVVNGTKLGKLTIKARCKKCSFEFEMDRGDIYCAKCYSENIEKSLFQGSKIYRDYAYPLPKIKQEFIEFAKNYIPDNTVALFARNRKTYGRNLSVEHYEKTIDMLIDLGYNVVLLGESVSSYNLNNDKIINFFDHELAGNLEAAFAIVDRCVFSLQFFTASTRISSILNKPFILVESIQQIYGLGQEGIRISLMSKNIKNKKLILANFVDAYENTNEIINLVKQAINDFIVNKNADDLFFDIHNHNFSLRESDIKRLW